jgi:hypothetical protein
MELLTKRTEAGTSPLSKKPHKLLYFRFFNNTSPLFNIQQKYETKKEGCDIKQKCKPESSVVSLMILNFQPATQLIREVATLELEIKHLEQYLLTLYLKAFE